MKRKYPVPFESWKIGMQFWMSGKQYRVTDVGSRTLAAIPLETLTTNGTITFEEHPSWWNGPPYAVVEQVIDEHDLQACYLEKPDDNE